jgi:hypothetical protein
MEKSILTISEISDLNNYIYEKLRYEFGKQVDPDWCTDFTTGVVAEAERIRLASQQEYFAARNKQLELRMKK